ncbi:MAG: tetratricopeptide repeat protein [Betaproteobacteria bacterium]|nr:tetratricopeptide repeat protein [Betaproteobacteria bacterium]
MIVTANESALAQFEKLARLTDDELDLARAALLIAKGRDASVDVERYVSELEFLAATLGKRLAPDANASLRIGALNQFLFQEMGFGPNRQDYYDPRNSFLNEVIDRRKGIPITLSLVYMEIGRRIGLPLRGVSFPGHFLVKCRLNQGMVVLDPYAGGASPSMADLQKRLRDARGGEVSRAIVAGLLVAADKRDILARMLRNLKAIYMRKEMDETAMSVVEWLMVLNPEAPEEVRDRGLLFERMECFRAALSDLERYLKLQPAADDVDDVYARVIELRQSAARLN